MFLRIHCVWTRQSHSSLHFHAKHAGSIFGSAIAQRHPKICDVPQHRDNGQAGHRIFEYFEAFGAKFGG